MQTSFLTYLQQAVELSCDVESDDFLDLVFIAKLLEANDIFSNVDGFWHPLDIAHATEVQKATVLILKTFTATSKHKHFIKDKDEDQQHFGGTD